MADKKLSFTAARIDELLSMIPTLSTEGRIFATSTAAASAITKPLEGNWVFIGTTSPYTIYRYNGSSWVSTGVSYSPGAATTADQITDTANGSKTQQQINTQTKSELDDINDDISDLRDTINTSSAKFSDYEILKSNVRGNTSVIGGDFSELISVRKNILDITDIYAANKYIGFDGGMITMGPYHGCVYVDLKDVKHVRVNTNLNGFSGAEERPIAVILNSSGIVVRTFGERTGNTNSINEEFDVQASYDKLVINYDNYTGEESTGYVYYSKVETTHFDGQQSTDADTGNNQNNNAEFPLGVADNFGHDILIGASLTSTFKKVNNSVVVNRRGQITRDANSKILKIELGVTDYVFTVKIKKQSGKYLMLREISGGHARYKFNELANEKVLYVVTYAGEGTKPLAYVDDVTDDYVFIRGAATNTIKEIFVSSDFGATDYIPFEMDEPYFGLFDPQALPEEGIIPNKVYKSRSEKLNSPIRGKVLVTFGDSTWAYAPYLFDDWGAIVYNCSDGGRMMGYEEGKGEDCFLCTDSAIQLFREVKPSHVDYIINMTGTNGKFDELPTVDKLKYCISKKRWYHSSASNNNGFDSLTEENKVLIFTSPACYIAAFWSLGQLYPNAQAVVVEPDFFNAEAPAEVFTNKKWTNMEQFATCFHEGRSGGVEGIRTKINLLKEIAFRMRAIYVSNESIGGLLNAPYRSADGVHPRTPVHAAKAALIAHKLMFPTVSYNLTAGDGSITRYNESTD